MYAPTPRNCLVSRPTTLFQVGIFSSVALVAALFELYSTHSSFFGQIFSAPVDIQAGRLPVRGFLYLQLSLSSLFKLYTQGHTHTYLGMTHTSWNIILLSSNKTSQHPYPPWRLTSEWLDKKESLSCSVSSMPLARLCHCGFVYLQCCFGLLNVL